MSDATQVTSGCCQSCGQPLAPGRRKICRSCVTKQQWSHRPRRVELLTKQELDAHVEKLPDLPGCWLWTGATDGHGYGHIHRRRAGKGRNYRVHRLAYELFYGSVPPGKCVRHSCDTPLCANPAHLFPGTKRGNTADCIQRGRFKCVAGADGDNNAFAILTSEQVRQIRSEWTGMRGEQTALAQKYGVTKHCIWRVIHGKNWRTV